MYYPRNRHFPSAASKKTLPHDHRTTPQALSTVIPQNICQTLIISEYNICNPSLHSANRAVPAADAVISERNDIRKPVSY